MTTAPHLLRVRLGRSPNCSATGSVVGLAIVSAVATAALVNAFADRFARWRDGGRPGEAGPDDGSGGPPPPTDRPDPEGPATPEVRVRHEAFGGIVAWPSPAALLYVDAVTAQAAVDAGARVVGPAVAQGPTAPTEVHVAVTARCPVRCDACYLDAGPDAPDTLDLPALDDDLRRLAAMGVFEVALGGGEAALRDDVVTVAERVRAHGMVPNLTTSGFGITPELARRLAPLVGQVNVSLDGLGDHYAAVRGWRGEAVAVRALQVLRDAGLRTGVNTVLTRATFDHLPALAETLTALGVSEWQWLRLKPAGRGAEAFADATLTPEQALAVWPTLLDLEARTGLVVRIDCALVPFLVAHGPPLDHLEAHGVSGCPGGQSLWSRGVDGTWSPCSFAHDAAADGSPDALWATDPTLQAWRDRAATPPAPCADCTYRAVCRGGCRVVARHLTGDALAADPECPRVRALEPA
ncbi:MAG: radical SAM protein [Alphaproteobacteria bacterium]|nr:radical SAM protein [Alphaproteobacteria bacterium]